MLKETFSKARRLPMRRWNACCRQRRSIPLPSTRPCATASLPEASACVPSCAWKRRAWSSGATAATGVDDLGAAIEMLHTYSLVHDDLPALDNDDLRRGRPTCHNAFGEATAILAGDALQTQAYEVMARLQCPAEARVRIIEELAHGTGTIDGMIGGQVVDLESEHVKPDLPTLEYIHRAKTGALIVCLPADGLLLRGRQGGRGAARARIRTRGRTGLPDRRRHSGRDPDQRTAGQDRRQRSGRRKSHLSGALRTGESRGDGGSTDRTACSALDSFGERADTLKEIARYLVNARSK